MTKPFISRIALVSYCFLILFATRAEPLSQAGAAKPPSPQVTLTVAGKKVRGDYRQTHGKTLSNPATPYFEEYAQENEVDLRRLSDALFPKGFPKLQSPAQQTVAISSYGYTGGDWTYFESSTVVLYELLKVRSTNTEEPMFLVLYNRSLPPDVIIDHFVAEWHLALIGAKYNVLSDRAFTTRIKHKEEGIWDMIYAGLAIEDSAPAVRIMYTHTGGGGGRDQEFTFRFAVDRDPLRLKLLESKQTLDAYEE